MNPEVIRKSAAFTWIELIVVMVVLFIVASMFMPISRVRNKAPRISCINHLKQIGTAYRIWANDHGDRFPAWDSAINGGWNELLKRPDEGFMCWINYAIMSNELAGDTKILVCPSDERKPAGDFSNFNSNIHLSYLIGVSADNLYPQSLLAGDRNLSAGTNAARNYGFSPVNGQGNDVAIQTNSKTSPICWSLKIHSAGNTAGAGNILLGDGSAQQVTSGSLRANWQPNFGLTTNWPAGHVPSAPSVRVLFP